MAEEYQSEETVDIINNARRAQVGGILNVGYDLESSKIGVQQAFEHQNIYAGIGVHPTNVARYNKDEFSELDNLAHSSKVKAIGEIGLDYYHKNVSSEVQKKWFVYQIKLAQKNNLPVLIHCRDAYEDCYEILKTRKVNRGIMHCYLGDEKMAFKFIKLGLFLSFGGIVTFKNAQNIRNVVQAVPIRHCVVETDAPYLAPTPFRGKKNYPEYIIHTVQTIARLKSMSYLEVIKITTNNVTNLLQI